MSCLLYILNENGEPEQCEDTLKWARWMEECHLKRRVALHQSGRMAVSTIFLGMDHGMPFRNNPDPVLYETILFNKGCGGKMWRYRTREEALKNHAIVVKRAFDKRQLRRFKRHEN